MRRNHGCLAYLLVLISCTSSVASQYPKIDGTNALTTHTVCNNDGSHFASVTLRCGSYNDVIHITRLQMDTRCARDPVQWSQEKGTAIDACEGKMNMCTIALDQVITSASYRSSIREIRVTFQCISGARVHSMCPTTAMTITSGYGQSVYFKTPGFTDSHANYMYSHDANCQCTAMPSVGGAVKMQLIYVDLETSGTGCYDYISVGSNKYSRVTKYCSKISSGSPTTKTYSTGEYAVIAFSSDGSNSDRGAWFTFSPDSSSATVSISCRSTVTTTVPTTTIQKRTPRDISLRGTSALHSFRYCSEAYNYREVTLICSNNGVIHISHLQLDVNEHYNCSGYGDCTKDFTDYMKVCEGKRSSCTFRPSTSGYARCAQVNHIELTFQCVPETKVNSLCPATRTTTTTNGQPVFFSTPQFTEPGGVYSDYTDCQCTAVPSSGQAITISIPYLDLETASSGCYDYISISQSSYSTTKYCHEIQRNDNPKTSTFYANTPAYIKFHTDQSTRQRGTWFSIKTATEVGSITITCTDSDSTAIPPTTTSRTTTPYRNRETGTIATFYGTGLSASYGKCFQDRITDVNLECNSSDDVIHISHLTLAKNSHTDCSWSTQCTWSNDKFITACEGKKSSCTFYTSQQYSSYCSSINQINITFQCVPSASIHSMCPSTKTETSITSGLPAYFTTPQFTTEGGQYSSNSNCQCYAVPADNAVVKAKMLYAVLEGSSPCIDYISFGADGSDDGSGYKYCQQLAIDSFANRSFGAGNTVSFHFVSDSSLTKRGAWFAVYTASDSDSLTMTCNNQPFASPERSARISGIIGGAVGGGLSVVVIVSIVLIYCTRRMARAANQSGQSNQTQSPSSMMLRPGTAPPYAAGPSIISGQASTYTTGSESRGNADEPPPSYSELNIPSEQQTATSLI